MLDCRRCIDQRPEVNRSRQAAVCWHVRVAGNFFDVTFTAAGTEHESQIDAAYESK